MALALDVSGILAVKEVSVVQSIDLPALQAVLLQLASRQAAAETQLTEQREVIDGLKAQIASKPQTEVREGSTAHAAVADTSLTRQGNKELPATVDAWHTELQQLQQRVAHLEESQSQHGASQGPLLHSVSIQPAEPQPAHTAAATEAAPTAAGDASAVIDTLRRGQEQLAQQVADVQHSLAGTADSIQQQLSTGLNGKADVSIAQALQELLLSKADQSTVDQLRRALADKADRSELDLLLSSLSSSMATSVALVDGEREPAGADNAGVAGGGEAAAATTRALQLQLTLLQDRLGKKADALALEDAAAGLVAAHQDLAALKLTTMQLTSQLADISKSLSDVQGMQQTGQHLASMHPAAPLAAVSSIPAAVASSTATSNQPGTSDSAWDKELQRMLARLAAVETALRGVPPAAPTAAQSTVRTDSKGPTSSGMQAAMSGLGPAYAGEIESTLQRLAADAADLRCQVLQLKQAVDKSSCSRDVVASETMSVQSHQAAVSTGRPSIVPDSMHSAVLTAAEALAGTAVGADSIEPALQDVSPELDAGVAVMFEDLSARLVGLQALVDNLVASKADRGEVERLQTMLADTATQSDTDMLRHKLDAQQQQLARLHSITQRLAGSTAGVTDTAPSPRAAATRAAAPEASYMSVSARSAGPAGSSSATAAEASGAGATDAATADELCLARGTPCVGVPVDGDQVLAGIEQVAQAICLLATGQAAAAVVNSGTDSFSFKSTEGTSGSASREDSGAGRDAGGANRDCGVIGPHTARLKRLLKTGQVGMKLDWFDPTLLQKMAQRLAATEALIKNAQRNSGLPGSTGHGDLEARVNRLAAELRVMKDRLGDIKPAAQGGWRGGDGDHTMLAAKPLAGYRCMACDRPLGSLDPSPGPYLPSGQMPLPGLADTPALAGKLPPAGGSSRRNTVQDAVAVPGGSDAASPDNPGRRVTGQQNWYAGPPAEQLPRADVGPQLPPGGWRAGQSREDGNLLPALPPRGGSPMGR